MAVDTRPVRFAVDTKPIKLAVDTRPAKFAVLTTDPQTIDEIYPNVPSPLIVDATSDCTIAVALV